MQKISGLYFAFITCFNGQARLNMLQCPPSLSLGCRCTCPLCCRQDTSPSLAPVWPKSLSLPTHGKRFSQSCLEQTPRGAPCFPGLRASMAEPSAWRLLLKQLFLDSSGGGGKEQARLECFTGQTWPVGRQLASLHKSGFLAQTKGLRGAGASCPWRYPRTDVLGRLQEQASVERCFSPTSHRLWLRDVLQQRPCLCAREPLGDFSRVALSNRFLERRKLLASATSCGNEFL